ncbi:unnamed protein product [Brassica rapa subsp. narinosa]
MMMHTMPSFKAVQGCLKRCNNLWSRHGRVLHGHVLFIREDNCGTDVVGKVFNAEDTNRRTYSCTTNNAFDHTVVTGGPSSSNAKTKPEEEEVKFPWSRNPGHDNVVTPAQSETRKLEVVDEEEFEILPLFVAKSRFGRRRSGREHTPVKIRDFGEENTYQSLFAGEAANISDSLGGWRRRRHDSGAAPRREQSTIFERREDEIVLSNGRFRRISEMDTT